MAHAVQVPRIQTIKQWTIHEVREDLWNVTVHALGVAIYQWGPLENQHQFVWCQGHQIWKGKYKATAEGRVRGEVKWEPMVHNTLVIWQGADNGHRQPTTDRLPGHL